MRLFYLINNWAGRNDFFDEALRLFYVTAIPILATALAALLILTAREKGAPSRLRIALAAFISALGCAALTLAINIFAQRILGTEVLSPRPFVTHAVTALVVEPNDNSFPSIEVMLAAALAMIIWASRPRHSLWGIVAAFALAVTHIYCGTNYPIDVVAGLGFGFTIGALALALCQVPLAIPVQGKRLVWRLRYQAVLASLGVVIAAVCTVPLANAALYTTKMSGLFSGKAPDAETPDGPAQGTDSHGATHDPAMKEGEGATSISTIKDVPAPGVTEMGGYTPASERLILAHLRSARLPHRIVSIDVAGIKIGNSHYRCGAIRFEIKKRGAAERRAVMASAARIVRIAFAADSQLQNVDVTGVVLNGSQDLSATDNPSHAPAHPIVFTSGIVPIFSASIARERLNLTGKWAFTNLPNADAGLWLRSRSRLYINTSVLPPSDAPPPAPTPVPIPTPLPTPTAVPTATAVPTPKPVPTIAPPAVPTRAPVPVKPHIAIPYLPVVPHLPVQKPIARTSKPAAVPAKPAAWPTAKPSPPKPLPATAAPRKAVAKPLPTPKAAAQWKPAAKPGVKPKPVRRYRPSQNYRRRHRSHRSYSYRRNGGGSHWRTRRDRGGRRYRAYH